MSNKFEWIVAEPGKIILSGTPIYIDAAITAGFLYYTSHYGEAILGGGLNLAGVKHHAERKAAELIDIGLLEDPRVDPANVKPRGKIRVGDLVRCVKESGPFGIGTTGEVVWRVCAHPSLVVVRYKGLDGKRYETLIQEENFERLPE